MTITSASSSAPEVSFSPLSVNVSISSVTMEASPLLERLEQVAVRHEAHALLPGVVTRVEVGVDVVALGQAALHAAADHLAHQVRASGGSG